MDKKPAQVWDLWYPKAGATGMPFARCRIDPVNTLLVHSVPPEITVRVEDENGAIVAQASDLKMTLQSPITRLTISNGAIRREDIWPTMADIGQVIVLPGGEAGILLNWWNAEDLSEWRWRVEFYNHR